MSELLGMDEPRRRFAAMMSGLDIHYDLGEGHPLLGRRMPDLDLVTANGPLRVFTLLHDARPVLLNLGEPGGFDITPWADRVQLIDAKYVGAWELPALGAVTAPTAVLIRPDGYVAWVGDLTQLGLADVLTTLVPDLGATPSSSLPVRSRTTANAVWMYHQQSSCRARGRTCAPSRESIAHYEGPLQFPPSSPIAAALSERRARAQACPLSKQTSRTSDRQNSRPAARSRQP